MNLEELRARQDEIRTRLQEIDREAGNRELSAEARSEWNSLNEEHDRNETQIGELTARSERLAELSGEGDEGQRERGASFHTPSPSATRGDDIYDLTSIRSSVAAPEEATREMRDRAHRAIERARFAHENADRERCQEHVERLVQTIDGEDGTLSRRILATGSPLYERAFGKALKGAPLTGDEARALSLTGSAGGFAVPFTLDPTIIPTSNHSVNPFRAISRVESITGKTWQGISSAGITAGYAAEAAEAGDNAPTLAQPEVTVKRAQAFVPFSIEIDQDWGGLQGEMAKLLSDAKDDLEASEFAVGDGTGDHLTGLITALVAAEGTVPMIPTAGDETFAAGDLDEVENALGPRFRSRARWVGNRAIYNKVRHFDTNGGAALWKRIGEGLANNVPVPGNLNAELLGYPAHEVSSMDSTIAEDKEILVLGDFGYFLIVDRIGMNIELVQHLFGANRRPTGQRGIYAIWRNNVKVLSANAFRVLQVAATP